MLQNLTGWHALLVLAIVLLVFGAAKLPALARSLGQSVRILKQESADATDEPAPTTTAVPVAASVPPAAQVAAPAPTPASP
ncbi:Sec-independent protein translocase subunit TatA/TatB [Microbacterium dauci]|uniref:Sec-independent protein translocase protein TatA n=1 Tax=Microbacterium dauci TaxID=3048008 RepID=A0ABT6ZDX8_9MICO|nr:twin-arginine translocase TatA/TatE family subunit [Microbacterium sp. LX3-4]MDJ1113910.1 twin-arginine translocase TatA/TatE family subunit [Microbacterium sp. LX3-4]